MPRRGRPGTIPACAGSTCSWLPSPTFGWDHPRVRGEHDKLPGVPSLPGGPSPRARGARAGPRARWTRAGTIPACAGSTLHLCSLKSPVKDHPRVRGEHSNVRHVGRGQEGPSPRARGAPVSLNAVMTVAGTIPACAGSTWRSSTLAAQPWDHPRVRGEHDSMARIWDSASGPSPRARGALRGPRQAGVRRGTIPACAGSTRPSTRSSPGWRDHPRVRGEHTRPTICTYRAGGPSPRARGAQDPHA